MSLWEGAIMNKKINLSLLLIALAVFVFGIAWEGYAQEHSLTVNNTGAGKGTVAATSDVKTPAISLSTDKLEFDFSTGRIIVLKTLVISNIGTGNLTVSVSGLEGTGFKILGRSNFTVRPGWKHNLMVYILSSSLAPALQVTDAMGTDERVSGSGASDGGNTAESEDIEELQGRTLGAGNPTPTKMSLNTNDPNHPVELVELAPLVPVAGPATLKIDGIYHQSACRDSSTLNIIETGQIKLEFTYLPDKGYYNIVCGGDTCKGSTNASGSITCTDDGCGTSMIQNGIQWIIYGNLSKDKSTLTLNVFHATDDAKGQLTLFCPNSPSQTLPSNLIKENFMYPTITIAYKQGAQKKVSFGTNGEKTYTLSSVTE
jgi:hypothetical protein